MDRISKDSTLRIRRFKPADVDAIAGLFHETVRKVNIRDYDERQVRAWAPDNLWFRDREAVCTRQYTLVAEIDGIIVGFTGLEEDGHIDCFYCHRRYQRKGIGKALFRAVEAEAKGRGLRRLYLEASITARPFFLAMGFVEKRSQEVPARGVILTNYRMVKKI